MLRRWFLNGGPSFPRTRVRNGGISRGLRHRRLLLEALESRRVLSGDSLGAFEFETVPAGTMEVRAARFADAPAAACAQPGAIEVWQDAVKVAYRTCDPRTGSWVSGSVRTNGEVSDLSSDAGVVAWVERTTDRLMRTTEVKVVYVAFDPVQSAWNAASEVHRSTISDRTAELSAFSNAGGVVAWSVHRNESLMARGEQIVAYATYDPGRGAWQEEAVTYRYSTRHETATLNEFSNADGVVAWSITQNDSLLKKGRQIVAYTTYDPGDGRWQSQTRSTSYSSDRDSVAVAKFANAHGVVAWAWKRTDSRMQKGGCIVGFATYDPEFSAWKSDQKSTSVSLRRGTVSVDALANADGVVAWQILINSRGSLRRQIGYSIYDFAREKWVKKVETASSRAATSALEIVDATLHWTLGERDATRGYDTVRGRWSRTASVPAADFQASASVGETPLYVFFWGRSVGAKPTWSFGDGNSAAARRIGHAYFDAGQLTVKHTVVAGAASSTASQVVTVNSSSVLLVSAASETEAAGDDPAAHEMTAANRPWHNASRACDVDGDGSVTPLDALTAINWINAHADDPALPATRSDEEPFYDVVADGNCTPQDILAIINEINRR